MREIIVVGPTMQRARYGLDSLTKLMLKVKIPCKRLRDKLYILDKIMFIVASSNNIDKVMIGRHLDLTISYLSCEDEKFIIKMIKDLLESRG